MLPPGMIPPGLLPGMVRPGIQQQPLPVNNPGVVQNPSSQADAGDKDKENNKSEKKEESSTDDNTAEKGMFRPVQSKISVCYKLSLYSLW